MYPRVGQERIIAGCEGQGDAGTPWVRPGAGLRVSDTDVVLTILILAFVLNNA